MIPKAISGKRHWPQPGVCLLIFCGALAVSLLLIHSIFAPVLAAPNDPQPILPAEGDSIITPTFSWLPSGGAVKYKVQVGPQSDPLSVSWEGTTLNLNITPVDSIPNGPLYWRVGACLTSDCASPIWSSKVNFTKFIPAPALTSPLNHVALTGPAFGWDPVAGAASYKIEISLDALFNSIDYTFTTYNTSLTPNSTLAHGTYFWRVRGIDAAGHEGANSLVWTFVKYIPGPMTVAPSAGQSLIIPTLEWKATEDTAYYRVEISPNSAFNPIIFTDLTYATRLTPKTSLAHGVYYWRVRGVDADGHEGFNSTPISFNKNISGPELLSPADNASVTIPTLDWGSAEGAVSYKVELSVLPTFNSLAASFTTYNTRLTPAQSLVAGTYYWRVRGLDSGGNEALNSSTRVFTLAAPPAITNTVPQLQTPSDGETISTDPTFRWTPVKGAASYLIKVSTSNTFTPLYDSLSVKYNSYTPYTAGVKFAYVNGTYYWKVEARNSSNQVIGASVAGSFIKQMPLPLAGPSDQATLPGDPSFQWAAVTGAKDYYVQVSASATFATTYDAVTTDYPAYTPYTQGIIYSYANGTYYWRVKAHTNSGSDMTLSQPRSFTKQVRVILSSPVNNAVLLTDPTFTWEKVIGAKTYYLKVSDSPTFATTYDAVTTDYTSYTPFTPGTKNAYGNGDYYWRVEARSNTGTSIIATSQVFSLPKPLLYLCMDLSKGLA